MTKIGHSHSHSHSTAMISLLPPTPPTSRRSLAAFLFALLCCAVRSRSARPRSPPRPGRRRPSRTILPSAHAFVASAPVVASRAPHGTDGVRLFSLKPAAVPLMDSGKALARSGELLIDLTAALDLYGGSLSATGANVRNCGDCLAQAAASCRFKTAAELVVDELREGGDCLREGGGKLSLAVKESEVDGDAVLMDRIEQMIDPTRRAAASLEEAGASIMRGEGVDVVGGHLTTCGEALQVLSARVGALDPSRDEGTSSARRMLYASEQMIVAGRELRGEEKEKPKGKSWIKG
ncbi:hypothetical protein ACHAWF_008456 [Thalassiosira exigua]